MSARKWQVIKGPDQESVLFALFRPRADQKFPLTVREANNPQGTPFELEVEVLEIWAGSRKTGRKPRSSWEGIYGFNGEVTGGCLQLTGSDDPEIVTTISVTYAIGNPIGNLEVVKTERHSRSQAV